MSDKDEDFTADELEAFKERELDLIDEEKSIAEAIDSLGLKKLSRETIERLGAKWYLELRNANNELVSSNKLLFSLINDIYKPFDENAKGLISLARDKGVSKAKSDASKRRIRTQALDKIEDEYKLKYEKGWFKLRGRLTKFVADMHAKYPMIQSAKSIENRLIKYKAKLEKGS